MTQHLHISIGPVQSFVAQARRTRDFWAGSFLLSWMAGQIMAETMHQGGEIQFPSVGTKDHPTDPLLAANLGKPPAHEHPVIGSLPNRFKASVPESLDPEEVVNAAKQKWRALAEKVWRKFVEPVAGHRRNTRLIWDRQIDGFWEIQWVMGADPGDGSDNTWLGARKNWRSHWPPAEGGDHCTVMGDWQELSGYARSRQRQRQDAFWKDLQGRTGRLDLRDGERLCAVALVKRLFPKLDSQALQETIGWPFEARNWPSTVYLAVAPWLAHIAKDKAYRKRLSTYVKAVREAVGENYFEQLKSECATSLPGLKALGEDADLNGNLFLETALANSRATPLNDRKISDTADPDEALRQQLLKELAELGKAVGGSAQPFYALLMMDGDRLGKLLRESEEQVVSKSLANFVKDVPEIVQKHGGVAVYAGGDDVLAMLPITHAIDCSIDLREAYRKVFKNLIDTDGSELATASCAVIFAHFHNPLRDVMKLAHKELDDTAKEKNGRDSLALAVMPPGGVNFHWVAKFGELPQALLTLRNRIWKKNYSSSFFYHLRQRYGELLNDCDKGDRCAIVLAEYIKGATLKDNGKQQDAKAAVAALVAACGTQRCDEASGKGSAFQLDGAFIARFLAETTRFDASTEERTP